MQGSLKTIGRVAVATSVGVLLAAAAAMATPRYVAPGGATTGDCTPPPGGGIYAPCDFKYAVESVSVDGDEVIVAQGDYSVSGASEQNDVTIHGEDGKPRPRVFMGSGSLYLHGTQAGTARHLELFGDLTLAEGPKVGEDLVVRGEARLAGNALLRDSVVTAHASLSPGDVAVAVATVAGSPQLRNVTAVASGFNSIGVSAASDPAPCDSVNTTVKNVIARADGSDLAATKTSCPNATAQIDVSFSNYRADEVSGNGQVNDGGGNQTKVDPLFVNQNEDDYHYHQLPTSPTIDAGTTDSLVGSVDFDGEARIIGSAPDIGADESPTRDRDADGVFEPSDNCATTSNPDQADHDADGQGDVCDSDDDNDGMPDDADRCPLDASSDRRDPDGDGLENPCDPDDDNDGVPDATDAFPFDPARSVRLPADFATDGDDLLNGTPGPDLICGLFGNDTINGLAGNDTLWGDACGKVAKVQAAQARMDGNDKISGGDGNDALYGAGGNDSLSGGKGNDKLYGGGSNDKLSGGKGRNSFSGGSGNDSVSARNGKTETVNCGSGRRDSATVDRRDKVKSCEKVRRSRR